MSSAKKYLACSVFVPCAVLSCAAAYAQETQRDTVTLEEVIVTAQKREERLLDVPLSISAFTDAALQDTGAAQLADFLESSPGVGIIDSESGTQSIQIRGVSSAFGNATVGYYLDELPFTFIGNTPAVDVRTFDLERVEVLRGPQGTLYGDGSIGGTIRILTKEPDLSGLQTAVDLTMMDTADGEESYGAKAMLNVPLKEDVVGLRIVASKEDFGGWIDDPDTGAEDINDREIDNYRVKLRFAPGEKLDVVLSAWHTEVVADESSASLPDRTSPSSLFPPERTTDEYDLYSATVRYEFAAFDLVSATSLMEFTDGYATTLAFPPGAPPLPFTIDNSQDLISEELRLTSNSEGMFRWTAGLFYREIERDTSLILEAFALTQEIYAKSESYAVFGEGTWSLFDSKVDVTLGLRYFEDDRVFTEPVDPATLAVIQTLDPNFTGTVAPTFDSTTPRLNVAFHASEDWLIYTNIAKGFRTGQTQPVASLIRAIFNGLTIPTSIDPETLWSYEVGAKGSLADGRVTLESAVYYNDWEDLQVTSVVDPVSRLRALINGGPARIRGVEIAAALQPVEGLIFRLSGSYADAEYSEDVAGTPIRAGDRVAQVPETTLSGAATYRWALASTVDGFVHGSVQYTSDRTDVVNVAVPSDATTVLDLRVGIESGSWGAYLFGDNLTDEDGAISASLPAPFALPTRFRPRTYGVNLRYNFD